MALASPDLKQKILDGIKSEPDPDIWAQEALFFLTPEGRSLIRQVSKQDDIAPLFEEQFSFMERALLIGKIATNSDKQRWLTSAVEAVQSLIKKDDIATNSWGVSLG